MVTFLAKFQLANLLGTIVRYSPLDTRLRLYLFLYLVVLKGVSLCLEMGVTFPFK